MACPRRALRRQRSSGGGNDASPTNQSCKKGEVWDKNKKKCVKAQSGLLPTRTSTSRAARWPGWASMTGRSRFWPLVQNQNDPRVLNYMGYSHRKAGRLDIGITYYRKALAIDPNFNLAREYLGEGYIAAGRIDLAMAELAAIEKSCGTTCEEYQDLSAAISAAN